MKKITVIGATGMIGIPVTKELIKAGFEVTALVRDINKAKNIFPNGVSFVKGDLNDKAAIASSLKNAEGLYINISTRPTDKETDFNPEKQGLDNIIEEVKKSTVKQVAYLSSFLARNYKGDWWVMNVKKDSITKIKTSGLNYTIFYPSNFMENFVNGMIRNGKITVPSAPVNNKAWWISGEDFGRTVANAFKTDDSINKEFSVQGLEPMTMKEAAEKFAKGYTKSALQVGTIPFGMMKFLGLFIGQMKFLSKLMGVMLNNVETFEAQSTWNLLGKPKTTIEEFSKK